MQTRRLGNSDMDITPVGFGAWAIGGGDWKFGWGPQDDQDSIATIHRALESGINWIDTAAVYGLGHSETVVGRAIKGMAQKPYIFTKCSRIWDDDGNLSGSLKAESLRGEVEDSLRRLDIEVIDLYQIHVPEPDEDLSEGWQTLHELQKTGKVRYIGVSNFSVEQMQHISSIAPITSDQPPYSIIRPDIEAEILPYCGANNIGTIIYSPLQTGLLSGKMTRERVANFPANDWRSRSPHFKEPNLTRNLKIADVLGEIAEAYNASAAEVAIAWTLRRPDVTAAIVGARRPDQVGGIIGAADVTLTDSDLERIAQVASGE